METPRILISDKLNAVAKTVMEEAGLSVDDRAGISPEELATVIGDYDALIVRSRTKVTDGVLAAGTRLKLVGRAGIGVDNIDVPKATERGVIVMNAPHGNSVTTAELAIAHMFSQARNLVSAGISMRDGRWEKKKLMGREITGSVLGVVGLGNIGRIVAKRALALEMRVLGYDPFVSSEQMRELGLEPCTELESLLDQADFVTLHTPLTPGTRHMIGAAQFQRMKPTATLINCSRGGIVDEDALLKALEQGEIAGASLDVFETEPPGEHPLLAHPAVYATPHLGASSHEAQQKVARELAEQFVDYFTRQVLRNALNRP